MTLEQQKSFTEKFASKLSQAELRTLAKAYSNYNGQRGTEKQIDRILRHHTPDDLVWVCYQRRLLDVVL